MTAATGREADAGPPVRFARSRARVDTVLDWLDSEQAAALTHADLEDHPQVAGRQLLRQFLADHFELRALRETRLPGDQVVDADGAGRGGAEAGHTRGLATVFGQVQVRRIAYRTRGRAHLHPADAVLNLPQERHSHGPRRLAAVEASRGSFDDAVEAISRATGQPVGKRQVEDLAQQSAIDFDAFYAGRQPPAGDPGDVLAPSCDGKGVVMRPGALRPATRQAATKTTTKLATRLSKGEKRNRKRMAEVGAVYDATPTPRTPSDILPATDDERHDATAGPAAHNKWLLAGVVEDADSVVSRIFDEADRRDPDHRRTWVALVDGNNHQIDRIAAQARARTVPVTIIIDFVHVLEYLWKATWCFHTEGDPTAEA
ncbi:MAG: ISKra4 family transposase [Pseudonocardiaceae bacterium]